MKQRSKVAARKNQWTELFTILAVYISAVLIALLAGCATPRGTVQEISETEQTFRSYGVIWPDDASKDPGAYKTELLRGVMVTTVPATGGYDEQ